MEVEIQNTCLKVFRCGVHCYPLEGNVMFISSLKSFDPGKGNGTRCMEYLISAFRRMGYNKVQLVAMPPQIPNEKPIPSWKLINWYKRFGFIVTEYTAGRAEMEKVLCCSADTGECISMDEAPEKSNGKELCTTCGTGDNYV